VPAGEAAALRGTKAGAAAFHRRTASSLASQSSASVASSAAYGAPRSTKADAALTDDARAAALVLPASHAAAAPPLVLASASAAMVQSGSSLFVPAIFNRSVLVATATWAACIRGALAVFRKGGGVLWRLTALHKGGRSSVPRPHGHLTTAGDACTRRKRSVGDDARRGATLQPPKTLYHSSAELIGAQDGSCTA